MRTFITALFCVIVFLVNAQQNPVVTTFPSLVVHANSRGMSMGDNGIASASGNQALSYNPAQSAFTQNFHQANLSYMPWLTGISNDTRMLNVNYLAGLNNSALGFNLNYLDLGAIETRDDNGATLASYKARDFNMGVSYALQFASQHALSVTMKFIGQNQFEHTPVNTYSFCGDIGYYGFMNLGGENKKLQWGAIISNLGPKINLPTTAGIGIGYTSASENSDQLSISLDATRLLADDWSGLRLSAGMEYAFAEQFFLRGGVAIENKNKGNRKFISLGAGYKGFVSDQSFGLDVHYLVPFGTVAAVSPFQNAWGITLGINMGSFQ
ncbi:MAG: PorV/PorQ family protein [Sediminibacterium sp.]